MISPGLRHRVCSNLRGSSPLALRRLRIHKLNQLKREPPTKHRVLVFLLVLVIDYLLMELFQTGRIFTVIRQASFDQAMQLL